MLAGTAQIEFAGKIRDLLNDVETIRAITLVIIGGQKRKMSLF